MDSCCGERARAPYSSPRRSQQPRSKPHSGSDCRRSVWSRWGWRRRSAPLIPAPPAVPPPPSPAVTGTARRSGGFVPPGPCRELRRRWKAMPGQAWEETLPNPHGARIIAVTFVRAAQPRALPLPAASQPYGEHLNIPNLPAPRCGCPPGFRSRYPHSRLARGRVSCLQEL